MYRLYKVHVFQCEIIDKPGGVAGKLQALAQAGAHLEYINSERSGTKPGVGELLVAPRANEHDVVRKAGFREVQLPIVMRFEGDDKTGLGSRVTQAWEAAGINLHGLMMAAFDTKFVGFITFDTAEDANKAATILADMGAATPAS